MILAVGAATVLWSGPIQADCKDATIECWGWIVDGKPRSIPGGVGNTLIGDVGTKGRCWDTWDAACKPCDTDYPGWHQRCNEKYEHCRTYGCGVVLDPDKEMF